MMQSITILFMSTLAFKSNAGPNPGKYLGETGNIRYLVKTHRENVEDDYYGGKTPSTTNFHDPDCVEKQIDFYGNDIEGNRDFKVISGQDCAMKCGKHKSCEYWTYRETDKHCFFKTSNWGKESREEYYSGKKGCLPDGGEISPTTNAAGPEHNQCKTMGDCFSNGFCTQKYKDDPKCHCNCNDNSICGRYCE